MFRLRGALWDYSDLFDEGDAAWALLGHVDDAGAAFAWVMSLWRVCVAVACPRAWEMSL